jgi:peptidoglycan hydrolase-like protein with peptidoglycan-binding domain
MWGMMRRGFAVFFVLCGLFGANMFALQSGNPMPKRIIFPGSAVSEPPPPNSTLTAKDAAATAPTAFSTVTTGSVTEPDLIRAVQRELHVLGYDAGTPDGVTGLTTRAAIMAFEWDHGQPLTGEPTQQTLQALLMGNGATPGASAGAAKDVPPGPQAALVIRAVQQGLTKLGVSGLTITGTLTPETQRAIRLFEAREGLTETGRISGSLAARIIRLTGDKRLAAKR